MKSVEEQYWASMHDSVIKSIDVLDYHYDKETGKIWNNCLIMKFDLEGSYGCVEEMRFFNFSAKWKGGKIKDFSHYINNWWLNDELKKSNDKYVLSIELERFENKKGIDEIIDIQFVYMIAKYKS